jgi:hypothetical protein
VRRPALASLVLLAAALPGCRERFDSREAEKSHQAQEQQVRRLWFDRTGARLFAETAAVIRVWDVASGALVKRVGPGMTGLGTSGGNVELAPDLSAMAVFRGSNRGGTLSAYIGDLDTPSWSTTLDYGVSVVGLGAGGSVLAVSGTRFFSGRTGPPESSRLLVWRPGGPTPALQIELEKKGWAWVSPDGTRAAFVRGNNVVIVDVAAGTEMCEISTRETRGMLFSEDSTRLAILEKRALRFTDPGTCRETASVDIGTTQLRLLSFPGDLFAATFLSDAVYRYDAASGALRWMWSLRGATGGPARRIWKFAAAADANRLVFSLNNDLAVIDPRGTTGSRTLCRKPCYGPNTNLIEDIATSPDGETAAVASGRGLALWSTSGSQPPRKLTDLDLK